jgi:hypothetical protein
MLRFLDRAATLTRHDFQALRRALDLRPDLRPRHPALTASLFRQHDSFERDALHGGTAERSGVEFSLAPEVHGAGALPAVRAVAVADGANGLRRVRVMQRHPLGVGLRGLRMNRLAVQAGDVRRWQVFRGIERTETIERVEPPEFGAGSRVAPGWSAGTTVRGGCAFIPRIRQNCVNEFKFVVVKPGLRIGGDPPAGVLEKTCEPRFPAAIGEGDGRGGEPEEGADARFPGARRSRSRNEPPKLLPE